MSANDWTGREVKCRLLGDNPMRAPRIKLIHERAEIGQERSLTKNQGLLRQHSLR